MNSLEEKTKSLNIFCLKIDKKDKGVKYLGCRTKTGTKRFPAKVTHPLTER